MGRPPAPAGDTVGAAGVSPIAPFATPTMRWAAVSGRLVRWLPVIAATALAAALRLASFGAVAPNPYYDAAVRSMSMSWRSFFFGAFEPGGAV